MSDIIEYVAVVILLLVLLFGGISIGAIIYDSIYISPVADNNANNYCKSLGFDQFKDYSRKGIWSTTPIGIRCEYAEKYTDLGVRSNP